jgi:hypothetical protein
MWFFLVAFFLLLVSFCTIRSSHLCDLYWSFTGSLLVFHWFLRTDKMLFVSRIWSPKRSHILRKRSHILRILLLEKKALRSHILTSAPTPSAPNEAPKAPLRTGQNIIEGEEKKGEKSTDARVISPNYIGKEIMADKRRCSWVLLIERMFIWAIFRVNLVL